MPRTKGVTAKQRAFVREYAIDPNATKAALRAGYSKRSARSSGGANMKNPAIRAMLAAREAKASAKCEVTLEWMLSQLMGIVEDKDAKNADRVAAIRELGKLTGLAVKRIEASISGGLDLSGVSDGELKRLRVAAGLGD